MFYQHYMDSIKAQGYHLDSKTEIFRDAKGAPKCFNGVFQDLVVRQKNVVLSKREYELYGRLVMTLVQIVLNNRKFKFQDPDIREECRTEAYCDILSGLVDHFDALRGSTAYAYAFRIAYTAGIHVLERLNMRRELDSNLIENAEDLIPDCGHKVTTDQSWLNRGERNG